MAEEVENQEEAATEEVEAAPEPAKDEPKIMCYVSKRMVPKNQTVELEYAAGKKVWVLSKYIKFDLEGDQAIA